MSLELSMVGLVVHDMAASLEFHRRLGVDIPESADSEDFVMHRMESGVTVFWDTEFAESLRPDGAASKAGGKRHGPAGLWVSRCSMDRRFCR